MKKLLEQSIISIQIMWINHRKLDRDLQVIVDKLNK
jgi:hypothetical protein